MELCLVGLDHTTAPVEIREQLAFSHSGVSAALAQLVARDAGGHAFLTEAAILSTCNRVEVYAVSPSGCGAEQIMRFLARFHQLETQIFAPYLFVYSGIEVAEHLCATAAGLRSLVLGEAQIQGQVRSCLGAAQEIGSAGPVISLLFRHALHAGKRVRSETAIGQGAASVSQAGVELARRRLGSLEQRRVLLVGSGAVSELAAQNLLENGAQELMVVNRTLEHGRALAERYGAQVFSFDELQIALGQADIVISSTSAPVPVIYRRHIEVALQRRARQCAGVEVPVEMLLIDLAVPRDVAPDVAELPGVEICTIDDLHEVVSCTLAQRSAATAAAQAIVAEEVAAFCSWLRGQDALPTLAHLRQHAETLRTTELARVLRQLNELSPEQRLAVEAFSQSLVNKLLHTPTLRTRHAAAQGEGQRYAAMLRELFNL